MIRKEKPISAIIDELIKRPVPPGAEGPKPKPKPEMPGKPKPMPIRPKPTEGLKQIAKSDNYTLMAKRMNDPNGFYYN